MTLYSGETILGIQVCGSNKDHAAALQLQPRIGDLKLQVTTNPAFLLINIAYVSAPWPA